MNNKKELPEGEVNILLETLRNRFEKNMNRHKGIDWSKVRRRLEVSPEKLWSLNQMEETEGEPDVIGYDAQTDKYLFCDCAAESPKGRRSVCYDPEALASRKEHKPRHSAVGMAQEMGVSLLTEEQYHALQQLGEFDIKTSSWIVAPPDVRKLGGGLFGDKRYGRVFIYHNGVESYYAARGFRVILEV
ncbi:DUF4256 domain-containing protein [Proteiniphilum sp.]|uniref:DUF4256 domain-containing protein n=1 Tax=Proteiniphilum sp. TaxID=1926877 RepID=UPI002B21B488|nr:DUF4256 domain-containing protein [Proteiniphilum sp.]MEA4916798.1 DUF4256 domain-containing protein [Proteiniphilum sp.]